MYKTIPVITLAVILAAANAAAVEVKLLVEDTAGVSRMQDVVTTGIPFARGVVKDVSRLSVRLAGEVIPAQFLKLVPWNDGSVRWALMDCQVDVPADGKTELLVRDDGGNPAPAEPVTIRDQAAAVAVSTGPLEFTVSKKKFALFDSLRINGRELVNSGGRGLVIHQVEGGTVCAGPPESVEVEQSGPMRAIICIKGTFPGVHGGLLGYTVRITAYAGRKFVKVHTWLENHGAYGCTDLLSRNYFRALDKGEIKVLPEWFAFDGMAVELGLDLGGTISATCEGATAADSFSVEQRCLGALGHGKKEQVGYKWDDFEYTIAGAGKDLKKGKRTDGIVKLQGTNGRLDVAIRNFWQNYEKAIELDGATLKLWLWPTDGEWPRNPGIVGQSRGKLIRTIKKFYRSSTYHLAGGVHKGCETILDFSGRGILQAGATVSRPLMARAAPAYYASTEAAPGMFAPADFKSGDAGLDFKFQSWNQMARNSVDVKGKTSIYYARRGGGDHLGYWYGWMDFGDICGERGPCSLRYDWPWIMLINYLRMGDRGFFELGTEMARHRFDVDQCWSDRELPKYRWLSHNEYGSREVHFWPLIDRKYSISNRNAHPCVWRNWLSGVVLYYMLTGEPKAYECCMCNYRGIRNAWVEPNKKAPGAKGLTLKSMWSIQALCSLYDLTADGKYLDDALSLFNNHLALQWKAGGPHLLGWEQKISRSAVAGYYPEPGRAFCFGSQALCELYQRTGGTKVLELLTESCKKEFPSGGYSLSPLFRSNVCAFLGHKAGNQDYVDEAAELFLDSFPESANPPCFRPKARHWSSHSALLLRNGHILQYVLWCLQPGQQASQTKVEAGSQ